MTSLGVHGKFSGAQIVLHKGFVVFMEIVSYSKDPKSNGMSQGFSSKLIKRLILEPFLLLQILMSGKMVKKCWSFLFSLLFCICIYAHAYIYIYVQYILYILYYIYICAIYIIYILYYICIIYIYILYIYI